PNKMRSWYFSKNFLAALGCVPSSAITAPNSTTTFGICVSKLSSLFKLLAYQPKCAAINVVCGCFINIRCCSSINVSHGAGSVLLLLRYGCVASSSQRSLFASIGSQKDFGSAV